MIASISALSVWYICVGCLMQDRAGASITLLVMTWQISVHVDMTGLQFG